jgi:hypothetical protein
MTSVRYWGADSYLPIAWLVRPDLLSIADSNRFGAARDVGPGEDTVTWFWIGAHADYNRLVAGL